MSTNDPNQPNPYDQGSTPGYSQPQGTPQTPAPNPGVPPYQASQTPNYGAPAPAPAPSYGMPAYGAPQSTKTNGLAIAALISSFFIGVLGLILGLVALNQIKRTGEQGRGLALAGTIIGAIVFALQILWVIIIVAVAANDPYVY